MYGLQIRFTGFSSSVAVFLHYVNWGRGVKAKKIFAQKVNTLPNVFTGSMQLLSLSFLSFSAELEKNPKIHKGHLQPPNFQGNNEQSDTTLPDFKCYLRDSN
jgi:hypothetical protein